VAEPSSPARPRDAAINTGLGRVLLFVYGIFALSASARATVQIATKFSEAPLAYVLSAWRGDLHRGHGGARDRRAAGAA
jgi:hypothetical protein